MSYWCQQDSVFARFRCCRAEPALRCVVSGGPTFFVNPAKLSIAYNGEDPTAPEAERGAEHIWREGG